MNSSVSETRDTAANGNAEARAMLDGALSSMERLPLDLHHCMNRCGIMRIGKGYCYACSRLFAPQGLHLVPNPNELAGGAPAAAELSMTEGAKRLWDALPRVHVGVASHLPFVGRRNRAASHAFAIELKAFLVGLGIGLLAVFCCMVVIRACMTIHAVAELGR